MEDTIITQRAAKAEALRARGQNPFANDFPVTDLARDVHARFADASIEALDALGAEVTFAGRVMAVRSFGKAIFLVVEDRTERLQANVFRNELPEADWALLELLDVGDIIGVFGTVMRTRKGELSVKARGLRILTKALRPLPEKWHGLTDVAVRYRQRYLDLVVNPEVREAFRTRSRIVSFIRRFFEERDYLEVETPILQPIYGGAAAKPFTTHHNTLDMKLYLRVAPELNLKRLVVGGLHRVFELNRCFRNEGVSTRHNPEFTMLEFYQAFATYEDLMVLTEALFRGIAEHVVGSTSVTYGEQVIDFAQPFRRLSIYDGLAEAGVPRDQVTDHAAVLAVARGLGVKGAEDLSLGYLQMAVFEAYHEPRMFQPTFVIDFPAEVSPLSRKKDADPTLVDRFELYVAGRECANAFSELNDPVDQRSRFEQQVERRAGGDMEAHPMDEDYVRALEFGLPPTAGEGIGIDRLVMLFTNSASIRDVIFFPLMRPDAARPEG